MVLLKKPLSEPVFFFSDLCHNKLKNCTLVQHNKKFQFWIFEKLYFREFIFMDNIVSLYDSQQASNMAGLLFSNATLPRCVSAHGCFLKRTRILLSWLKIYSMGLFYTQRYPFLWSLFLYNQLIMSQCWFVALHTYQLQTSEPMKGPGIVSLTFRKLYKIILRKYTIPVITFIVRISSWNFVRVFGHTKFQLEMLIESMISATHKFRDNILESSRNVSETTPGLCHMYASYARHHWVEWNLQQWN